MNLVETQRVRANRNSWKVGLTREIINLEENLDQIYQAAALKPHRIVQDNDQDSNLATRDKITEVSDYATSIDGQILEVRSTVSNICALINSSTEFDLPIPIHVLLKIASRISSVRWLDYKKRMTGSLAKKYVYSKSLDLIETSLMLYRQISIVLGTNIIPYQPYINQNIFNILEWTRISDLSRHNEIAFYAIRSQIFQHISAALEQLSLNLNLEPKQLKVLLEDELVGSIEAVTQVASVAPVALSVNGCANSLSLVKDKYVVEALCCLEKLFLVYADFLDAPQECLVKNYVIQTCIKIYRDFEKNVIGLACRRQLLRLLESVASQPYASSTTEMAWHVFELAESLESDPDIRCLARRSLRVGLAHRPIIVSHHDVYRCYGQKMKIQNSVGCPKSISTVDEFYNALEYKTPDENDSNSSEQIDQDMNDVNRIEGTVTIENVDKPDSEIQPNVSNSSENEIMPVDETKDTNLNTPKNNDWADSGMKTLDSARIDSPSMNEGNFTPVEGDTSVAESDPEVKTFLSCFVDKPADSHIH